MTLDAPGQRVVSFASALRNASRRGMYADLIVEMFRSGAWREYTTALGPEHWRAHEYDYFLIACDARYEDIVNVLGWDTVRAAQLAEAMTGEPSARRRSLANASAAWRSPTGVSLIATAQRQGWIKAREKTPTLKPPPVPPRARVRAATGRTMDEEARRYRAKAVAAQRPALDALVAEILRRTKGDAQALRYIIDRVRRQLPRRGRPRGSAEPTSEQARWSADVAAANGHPGKLAEHWGVSPDTARKRVRRLADK